MTDNILHLLIEEYRGIEESRKYFNFNLNNLEVLATASKQCLEPVPPKFGKCAQLSAFLAGFLNNQYKVPAIAIAGSLKINNNTIFNCKENLPTFLESNVVESKIWDGHCWVEIDEHIIDISIFRTAYNIKNPSILKTYMLSKFGENRGAIICHKSQLPKGMLYQPKYVLTDSQIDGLVTSLGYELEHGT